MSFQIFALLRRKILFVLTLDIAFLIDLLNKSFSIIYFAKHILGRFQNVFLKFSNLLGSDY